MPLRLNHLQEKAGVNVQNVTDTLHFLVQEGCIPQDQLVSFQIELDWIQYKQNFREVVIASQGYTPRGETLPVLDILVDTRQVDPLTLRGEMLKALAVKTAEATRLRATVTPPTKTIP